MNTKYVAASIDLTAFCCPYCGAYTTQEWADLHINFRKKESGVPWIPTSDNTHHIFDSRDFNDDFKRQLQDMIDMMAAGLPFLGENPGTTHCRRLDNVWASKCYNCDKISLWVYKNLIFPEYESSVQANVDLPPDIRRDVEEARGIVKASPRGSAALLRLAIQKLCRELGESGKNLDDDIASLVKRGLNPLVQRALDVVRVIGNEAVHPGTLDLKDDRSTAEQLLTLVNLVADQMISHPKAVNNIYDKLPKHKLDAIRDRDSADK